jgi:hypothetical protein
MPRRGVRIFPAHQATIKAGRHIGPVSRAEQSLCSEGNFLASALKAESACAQRDTAFGKGLVNIEVILIDGSRTALVIVTAASGGSEAGKLGFAERGNQCRKRAECLPPNKARNSRSGESGSSVFNGGDKIRVEMPRVVSPPRRKADEGKRASQVAIERPRSTAPNRRVVLVDQKAKHSQPPSSNPRGPSIHCGMLKEPRRAGWRG